MITWKFINFEKDDESKSITIQEVIDGIPGKMYSAKTHKKHPRSVLMSILKTKIKSDRTKRTTSEVEKSKIDLTNFESFLGAP